MEKIKKILAIVIVVVLVALYALAFISAFFATPEAGTLFNVAIASTIFLPILLYIYLWMAKFLKGKGLDKNPETEKEEK